MPGWKGRFTRWRAAPRFPRSSHRSAELRRAKRNSHAGRSWLAQAETGVTAASLPADKDEADLDTESTFGREGSRAVALVAPTGRDSTVAERILASAGIETVLCSDMAE